jgi:hypothetical protein
MPAFSSPIDSTPWVTGGLWPAELSTIDAETSTLAEYLKADLQRIASSANDELRMIRRAWMAGSARQAEEGRVISEARARAVRRVESTVRHLQAAETDLNKTQVKPAATDMEPAVEAPPDADLEPQESTASEPTAAPVVGPVAAENDEPETSGGRHRADAKDNAAAAAAKDNAAAAAATPQPEEAIAETESESDRLQRLLAFVVRQEPRLSWVVGDHTDGTTVLVTDLAHGWIPPGIALPDGVRLLEPKPRTGDASTLVGETTRAAAYVPGDSVGRLTDFAVTKSSLQPRELPAVEDLGWQLGEATHWRDGLPRMVYTLAKAAAAGTGVVEEELDLLRVHLDTAGYQLLVQYPDVDPALLLNCLLLAATEGIVTGDAISANYHFAWFQKLNTPPASRWAANP